MPDEITQHERELIDAAVANGNVKFVPRGASAYEVRYNPETKKLAHVGEIIPSLMTSWGRKPVPAVAARRANLCALAVKQTVPEIVEITGRGEHMVRADLSHMGVSAKRVKRGPKSRVPEQ